MIVKKYTGKDETEAVMKAKDDLGSNAVVLNVRTMKQRGLAKVFKKDFVEITAALEEKDFAQNVNNNKPTFSRVSSEAIKKQQSQINLEKILFITQIILNLSISMITMSHIRIHKDQLFIPIP